MDFLDECKRTTDQLLDMKNDFQTSESTLFGPNDKIRKITKTLIGGTAGLVASIPAITIGIPGLAAYRTLKNRGNKQKIESEKKERENLRSAFYEGRYLPPRRVDPVNTVPRFVYF